MTAYVVFVHGVANRKDRDYTKNVAMRDERFRKLVFGTHAKIINPYWGDYGANPDGGRYTCLPNYNDPNANGVEVLAVAPPLEVGETPQLIDLARENFPETVDLIFASAFESAQENDDATLPDDAVREARATVAYAMAVPNPQWLQADLTNDKFLDELIERATTYAKSKSPKGTEEVESELLGLGSWLKKGATAMLDKVRNKGGRLALAAAREGVHSQVATFVGDVFRYLKEGSGRAPIRALMKETLASTVESGAPIILIGHSMGGVILADCLGDTAFCESVGLKDGHKVKALVTVGSQPGFFQELNLLGMEPKPQLESVENWINVFDELDVFSFLASTQFSGNVKDMMFSSRTGIFDAHSAYFSRIQFYERLRKRLGTAGVSVVGMS